MLISALTALSVRGSRQRKPQRRGDDAKKYLTQDRTQDRIQDRLIHDQSSGTPPMLSIA